MSGRVDHRPTSREHLAFALAAAVILLHALVAAFVALEPGAHRGDHLWAALVSSAVLVGAVWLYPRARAGLRASVAVLLGVLALAAGAVFLRDAMSGGPSGDDRTGMLLLPAGAVLAGLGVVVAWRSRKPTGHRLRRRALIAGAATRRPWPAPCRPDRMARLTARASSAACCCPWTEDTWPPEVERVCGRLRSTLRCAAEALARARPGPHRRRGVWTCVAWPARRRS